jgi:signal recognition particle subunit SRP54
LDALLKDICAALLESDVNVKLVSSLRAKVRAKVKPALESASDKLKESNRRQLVQKVHHQCHLWLGLIQKYKAIFDELVQLVDPGVEPYQPKKGQPNVIMAVGLQVRCQSHPDMICTNL